MKLHKTTEVIDALIGEIYQVGETTEDNRRFKNLEDLFEVLEEYRRRIEDIAEMRTYSEYSTKRAGKRAYEYRNKWTAYTD